MSSCTCCATDSSNRRTANQRLQEQLEQLEIRLGNPDQAHSALVHFGLKAVWRACREQIERYAEDLKRQRQDSERKRQLVQFQQDREDRRKEAEERLRQAEEVAEAEAGRLREREARMAGLRHFWHYFQRRDLAVEIQAQRERCVMARHHLDDMLEAQRTIEKEPWPEFAGLTLDGRRSVNLATIAYGQHLYACLAVSGLARDARLANNRGVEAAQQDSLEASLRRLGEITAGLESIRSRDGVADAIRRRVEALMASAAWREAMDTVPHSLVTAAGGDGRRARRQCPGRRLLGHLQGTAALGSLSRTCRGVQRATARAGASG